MVIFRGEHTDLVLPPTRALVRARRALAGVPGGGATPLAKAVQHATTLAQDIARQGRQPLVVFLTDGRGNIALRRCSRPRAGAGGHGARSPGLCLCWARGARARHGAAPRTSGQGAGGAPRGRLCAATATGCRGHCSAGDRLPPTQRSGAVNERVRVSGHGQPWVFTQLSDGPRAVLALHGTGASSHSFRPLAEQLQGRWALWAPDLPGHGANPLAPGFRPTRQALAASLGAALSTLAIPWALALGHSAGAAILLQHRLETPARARSPLPLGLLAPALCPWPACSAGFFPRRRQCSRATPLGFHASWPGPPQSAWRDASLLIPDRPFRERSFRVTQTFSPSGPMGKGLWP